MVHNLHILKSNARIFSICVKWEKISNCAENNECRHCGVKHHFSRKGERLQNCIESLIKHLIAYDNEYMWLCWTQCWMYISFSTPINIVFFIVMCNYNILLYTCQRFFIIIKSALCVWCQFIKLWFFCIFLIQMFLLTSGGPVSYIQRYSVMIMQIPFFSGLGISQVFHLLTLTLCHLQRLSNVSCNEPTSNVHWFKFSPCNTQFQ